jgi:predicted ATPase
LALHGQCVELPLRLLSGAAVREFVARCFVTGGETAAFQQLAQAIHARTDGNPLFIVNVVHDLIARGAVAEVDGQWMLKGPLEDVANAVPDNLRQMIDWQLDQLSADDRHVLEVASVAGMEFSAAAVAAGLEVSIEAAEERCAGLARREQFLRVAGREEWPDRTVSTRYGFVHALYADVAYQRIPAGRRAQLHQRIGERTEAAYGSRSGEIAAPLAVHFERGQDPRRAVQYLRQAVARAIRRSAHPEAIDHLRQQLTLLEMLPETAETAAFGLEARAQIASLSRLHGGLDLEAVARLLARRPCAGSAWRRPALARSVADQLRRRPRLPGRPRGVPRRNGRGGGVGTRGTGYLAASRHSHQLRCASLVVGQLACATTRPRRGPGNLARRSARR